MRLSLGMDGKLERVRCGPQSMSGMEALVKPWIGVLNGKVGHGCIIVDSFILNIQWCLIINVNLPDNLAVIYTKGIDS